jgi:EndoU nuclease-like protein
VRRRLPALLFGLLLAPLAAALLWWGAAGRGGDTDVVRHGHPAAACWPGAGGDGRPSWPCGRAAVSPQRRVHILDGDSRGGGHRPGRGVPNKSEFPRDWSDDRIIAAIEDVANDPASARRLEADGRTVVTGRRDGVAIRVVVERDGRSIVTGYPTNTPRNPG